MLRSNSTGLSLSLWTSGLSLLLLIRSLLLLIRSLLHLLAPIARASSCLDGPQVRPCQVGRFFSLSGLFCPYIRPLLTPVRTSAIQSSSTIEEACMQVVRVCAPPGSLPTPYYWWD